MNVTISVNQDEMIVKTPLHASIKDLKIQLQRVTGRHVEEQSLSYKNRVLNDKDVITSKMARDGLVLGTNQPNFVTVIPEAIVAKELDMTIEAAETQPIQDDRGEEGKNIENKKNVMVAPATIAIQNDELGTQRNQVVRNTPHPDPSILEVIRRRLASKQKPPFRISNVHLVSPTPENRYVRVGFDSTSTRYWKSESLVFLNHFHRMGLSESSWYNECIPNIQVTVWVYSSFLGCPCGTLGFYSCNFPLQCDAPALVSPVEYNGRLQYHSLKFTDPMEFLHGESSSAEIRFTVTFDKSPV